MSAIIFIVLVGGTYTTYVYIRNAKVEYADKVWTQEHLYGGVPKRRFRPWA